VRVSLLLTTFDRPDALSCVLESVRSQTVPPDELIVADDGSGADTRIVSDAFRASVHFPVTHVWQPHDGFRAGRARNLGLARTTGDYVVQIDGDMVLHPQFLADHRDFARHGHYAQGTRILLDEARTQRQLASGPAAPGVFSGGIGGLRRLYALRAPAFWPLSAALASSFVAVKGCNVAYWLEDARTVNGYDEAMSGWGSEDKEFCARLENAGLRRRTLLFGGIAWHLHHELAPRERHSHNEAILEQTRRTRRTRAEHGLDQHV
jgi:glycosyltransferase involved in cell wall biosynthesis